MTRRNWTLYTVLIVAALIVPVLFGLTPSTQAGLFQSPLSRNYLPLVANDLFASPLPTPTAYHLYLPLVVRAW
jgi:hypothetical protein